MNSLGLRITMQRRLAQFSSDTTLLDSSKWNPMVRIICAVDPDHTGLESLRNPVSLLDVSCEHRRSQTICRIVCLVKRFFFGLERDDRGEGTEDLFLVDLHVGRDRGEDGGVDEKAFSFLRADRGIRGAAKGAGGAFGFGGVNVGHYAVVLLLCDLGTLESVFGEGVADFGEGRSDLLEFRDELVVDAFLDEDTGSSAADLALVVHDPAMGPLGCLLDIGVVKDDDWGLATGLECDVFHVDGGCFLDLLAGYGGSGESDLVDVEVGGDCVTGGLAVTVENVDNTWWEPGFGNEFRKFQC